MSSAAPARDRATWPWRVAPPAGLLVALALGVAAVQVRDPHRPGSWGVCPFLLLTGRPCPFCGGLRAVDDLTHGDLAVAVHSNLLVVAALPVAAAVLGLWLWRRARGTGDEPAPATGRWGAVAAVVVVLGFGVVRLLPHLAWLTPPGLSNG